MLYRILLNIQLFESFRSISIGLDSQNTSEYKSFAFIKLSICLSMYFAYAAGCSVAVKILLKATLCVYLRLVYMAVRDILYVCHCRLYACLFF